MVTIQELNAMASQIRAPLQTSTEQSCTAPGFRPKWGSNFTKLGAWGSKRYQAFRTTFSSLEGFSVASELWMGASLTYRNSAEEYRVCSYSVPLGKMGEKTVSKTSETVNRTVSTRPFWNTFGVNEWYIALNGTLIYHCHCPWWNRPLGSCLNQTCRSTHCLICESWGGADCTNETGRGPSSSLPSNCDILLWSSAHFPMHSWRAWKIWSEATVEIDSRRAWQWKETPWGKVYPSQNPTTNEASWTLGSSLTNRHPTSEALVQQCLF